MNVSRADTQLSLIPGVQGKDNALVTHLGKNCRKIEETTEAILDEVLVGIETFYKEYNFQLKS